jgi:hypothetical protein
MGRIYSGALALCKVPYYQQKMCKAITEGRTKDALEAAGELASKLRAVQSWQRSVLRRKTNGRPSS